MGRKPPPPWPQRPDGRWGHRISALLRASPAGGCPAPVWPPPRKGIPHTHTYTCTVTYRLPCLTDSLATVHRTQINIWQQRLANCQMPETLIPVGSQAARVMAVMSSDRFFALPTSGRETVPSPARQAGGGPVRPEGLESRSWCFVADPRVTSQQPCKIYTRGRERGFGSGCPSSTF